MLIWGLSHLSLSLVSLIWCDSPVLVYNPMRILPNVTDQIKYTRHDMRNCNILLCVITLSCPEPSLKPTARIVVVPRSCSRHGQPVICVADGRRDVMSGQAVDA